MKIGLLVGREWSFPPAFIEEVNSRDAGVTAEYVKLGGTQMNEPCPYMRCFIDRISHEACLVLLQPTEERRSAEGVRALCRNNCSYVDCGRQILLRRYCWQHQVGRGSIPKRLCCPIKIKRARHRANRELCGT